LRICGACSNLRWARPRATDQYGDLGHPSNPFEGPGLEPLISRGFKERHRKPIGLRIRGRTSVLRAFQAPSIWGARLNPFEGSGLEPMISRLTSEGLAYLGRCSRRLVSGRGPDRDRACAVVAEVALNGRRGRAFLGEAAQAAGNSEGTCYSVSRFTALQ